MKVIFRIVGIIFLVGLLTITGVLKRFSELLLRLGIHVKTPG
ncbi:MAG: hypothetical protein JWL63_1802 [Rhodocyclales bacterium]|nr:hypothetical protein [Rhodocyclales bacterium]